MIAGCPAFADVDEDVDGDENASNTKMNRKILLLVFK